MKNGWRKCDLGDVLERTETVDPTRTPNKEFLYIDVSSVNNKTLTIETVSKLKGSDAPSRARKLVRTNDVIFATVRPTLKRIALIPEQYDQQVCSTGYFVFRGKEFIDNRFLFYFLQTDEVFVTVEKLQKGASYPAITDSDVKGLRFAYPPIEEQRRIVAVLDEAFAAIDKAKANTEKNIQNARELFDSYLNNIFSNPGPDWEMKRVGEIAKHSLGKMLDKRKNQGILKKYLRNQSVRWFEFDLSDITEMRFLESETEKYTAIKGDVLICEGGYPGRAAIWQNDEPIFFQKAVHRVRFHNPLHNRWLVYFLYLSDKNGNLRKSFTGAGIQHFTGEALGRFKLPIAPDTEMSAYLSAFEDLMGESNNLEQVLAQKMDSLDELKRSILQTAFSGGNSSL